MATSICYTMILPWYFTSLEIHFRKEEWSSIVAGMFDNEKFIFESSRCIYENSEIMVDHSFMSYPDETREAVMLVAKLKDGKILHIETGATPLD